MVENKTFYRVRDAASFLGIGKATLDKLRLTGDGPRFSKLGSKTVLYSRDDLLAWVEGNKVSSTSQTR